MADPKHHPAASHQEGGKPDTPGDAKAQQDIEQGSEPDDAIEAEEVAETDEAADDLDGKPGAA